MMQSKQFASQPTKRSALGEISVNNLDGKQRGKGLRGMKRKVLAVKGRAPIRPAKHMALAMPQQQVEAEVEEEAPMDTQEEAAAVVDIPSNVEDIDVGDGDNPLLVAEYVKEIYTYMRELEQNHRVNPSYIQTNQPDVNERMRTILIDWLVDVHLRFKLIQETMYLTTIILDRFLEKEKVARNKLQLAGITAMLIACKYEEMYPPEVNDFVYIVDNAYSRAEILEMESKMLCTLQYSLGTPLPLHFLRRYSKSCGACAQQHTTAKYLMELSLSDYAMVQFLPSQIASAAVYIARDILGKQEVWTPTLEYYSGYSLHEVKDCIVNMQRVLAHSASSKQQAVRNKYTSKKLLSISTMPLLVQYADEIGQ